MLTTNLRKVGGSVMLSIPPALLEELHLSVGEKVKLLAEQGRLVVQPDRPRYSLEELLLQCDATAPVDETDRDWLHAPAVGSELL